ncbi:protein NO VEIN domain-containing protein [Rufibacter sp. XAAS-G3-1]|uniref:protein NO VEIN domain-containing protein n=1 Tax=Rufibacter sp. XAAS-G3-1 TaxID=2729134 RepID=UPI0015E6F49D|nr:DUF3883 domain-containing protein [Rufibacter sp. XAAS-G3-1]
MSSTLSTRDKSILIGLYLSKFDEEAIKAFDFKGFNEAFNALGYSIGARPASIKNYRDEFDPLFPNPRKGWHKRPLREYCRVFYDNFSALDFYSFTELVKSFVFSNYEIDKIIERIEKKDRSESVAKRLITGRAAEEYFKTKFNSVDSFKGFNLTDTTVMACGFDFKLSLNENFYCVEVKGLSTSSGNISLTEKEFHVATELKHQFCLFIAMNFSEKPFHETIFDPVNSRLKFKKIERQITQVNYSSVV